MRAALRAVEANGKLGAILPSISQLNYLDSSSDVGVVNFTYLDSGVNADRLVPGREFAVIVDGNEIPNSRFQLSDFSGNAVIDGKPVTSWSSSTLLDRLRTALIETYTTGTGRQKKTGPPAFKDQSAGYILRFLIDKAHGRGAIPEIAYGFTADKDSAGVAWTDKITQTWDAGTSVLEVVQAITENYSVEFRMVGRTLMAYDTAALNTAKGTDALLVKGKNLIDGPTSGSVRDQVTAVWVTDDKGNGEWVVADATTLRNVGRIEGKLNSTSGDMSAARKQGAKQIQDFSQARYSYTYGVVPGKGADPYVDYKIGDWVSVMQNGATVRMRVREIAINQDGENYRVILTLNDLILERDLLNAKTVNNLRGATPSTIVTKPKIRADGLAPRKPSAPIVTSQAGVARIVYDGLAYDATDPESDQVGVQVHLSTASADFLPTSDTLIDTIQASGSVALNPQDLVVAAETDAGLRDVPADPYAIQAWVRFVAYDEGGDLSDPSDSILVQIPAVNVNADITGDGAVPTSSPDCIIAPTGPHGVSVMWSPIANADPVKYRVYLDTVSPPAQILTETADLVASSGTLPDGTTIDPGVPLYAMVLAGDIDGWASTPGAITNGAAAVVNANEVGADVMVVNDTFTQDSMNAGGALTIDNDNGMVVRLPNDGIIKFPVDGTEAEITANLRTKSLTVYDGLKVTGRTGNTIEGEVVVAAAIAPPANAPILTTAWDSDLYTQMAGTFTSRKGLFYHPGSDEYYIGRIDKPNQGWQEHDPDTGVLDYTKTGTSYYAGAVPSGGVIRRTRATGDRVVMLQVAGGWWTLSWYNPTTHGAIFEDATYSTTQYPTSRVPFLTCDDTYDYIAVVDGNGKLTIRRGNDVTSDTLGQGIGDSDTPLITGLNGAFPNNATITGFHVTNGILDSNKRFYVATSSKVYVYDGTSLRVTAEEFSAPAGDTIAGMTYRTPTQPGDSGLRLLGGSGKVYRLAEISISGTRQVKYAWYQPTGDLESTPSPAVSKVVPLRSWLRVTTEGIPNDGSASAPNRIRIYVDNLLQDDPGVDVTSVPLGRKVTGGKGSETVDDFANIGTPGLIRAVQSEWELHGSGEYGLHPDYDLYETDWIQPTLLNGMANYDATNVVQYRRKGNEVEAVGWLKPATSGNATAIAGSTGVVVFNFPVGFRPTGPTPVHRHQGSTTTSWGSQVNANGDFVAFRSNDGSPGVSYWMPFSVKFRTADPFPTA